ncbi:hypothetical protein C100_06960 [Sphingobium sp. C100]|nr:hypothetical protein C100_06960 [Sphingobium sp. C100]
MDVSDDIAATINGAMVEIEKSFRLAIAHHIATFWIGGALLNLPFGLRFG